MRKKLTAEQVEKLNHKRITIDFNESYVNDFNVKGCVALEGKITSSMMNFCTMAIGFHHSADLNEKEGFEYSAKSYRNTATYIHNVLASKGFYDDID